MLFRYIIFKTELQSFQRWKVCCFIFKCCTFVQLLLHISPLVDARGPRLGSWRGQLGRGDSGSARWRKSASDITAQRTGTWCTLGTFAWSRIYILGRLKGLSRELQLHPHQNKMNPSHVAKRVKMFFWTRGSVWEAHTLTASGDCKLSLHVASIKSSSWDRWSTGEPFRVLCLLFVFVLC